MKPFNLCSSKKPSLTGKTTSIELNHKKAFFSALMWPKRSTNFVDPFVHNLTPHCDSQRVFFYPLTRSVRLVLDNNEGGGGPSSNYGFL